MRIFFGHFFSILVKMLPLLKLFILVLVATSMSQATGTEQGHDKDKEKTHRVHLSFLEECITNLSPAQHSTIINIPSFATDDRFVRCVQFWNPSASSSSSSIPIVVCPECAKPSKNCGWNIEGSRLLYDHNGLCILITTIHRCTSYKCKRPRLLGYNEYVLKSLKVKTPFYLGEKCGVTSLALKEIVTLTHENL